MYSTENYSLLRNKHTKNQLPKTKTQFSSISSIFSKFRHFSLNPTGPQIIIIWSLISFLFPGRKSRKILPDTVPSWIFPSSTFSSLKKLVNLKFVPNFSDNSSKSPRQIMSFRVLLKHKMEILTSRSWIRCKLRWIRLTKGAIPVPAARMKISCFTSRICSENGHFTLVNSRWKFPHWALVKIWPNWPFL